MTVPVLEWALNQVKNGQRVALACVVESSGSVPRRAGARLALTEKELITGSVGGAGLELKVIKHLEEVLRGDSAPGIKSFLLNRNATKTKDHTVLDSLCGGKVIVSVELLEPSPSLLIIGGGHVGLALSHASEWLGWPYSIADIRKEWSNEERFPKAKHCMSGTIEELSESIDTIIDETTHIFLLSHDWSVDQHILIHLLTKECKAVIGVIGSKKKWNSFQKAALKEGIKSEQIETVRCPIGLNIGAETPEEIAIAIVSEVVAEHRSSIPLKKNWR